MNREPLLLAGTRTPARIPVPDGLITRRLRKTEAFALGLYPPSGKDPSGHTRRVHG